MSEETSEPSVSEQDRRGIDARFSTLEASVTQIQQTLQVIAQQQLAPRSTSTGLQAGLGMTTIVSTAVPSVQTGSSVHAPPFVSTAAVGGGPLPNANLTMPLHTSVFDAANMAQSAVYNLSGVSLPREMFFCINPQLFVSGQAVNHGLSISGGLPPVPGYIVNMVKKFVFVDFVLLLPSNLDKLPIIEPIGVHLNRLLNCDKSSDLKQIATFQDWAEAWSVFSAIVHISNPEKTGMLLSYFLLISKLQRDTPGTGWLDYDRAFRKKAAEDQSLSWSTVDITLFVTTVLAKSNSLISPATSKIVPVEKNDKLCLNWNFKSC